MITLELGKVFVIGSFGFVGQKLCRRLLELGVVVVDIFVAILLSIVASTGTIVGNRGNQVDAITLRFVNSVMTCCTQVSSSAVPVNKESSGFSGIS